MDETSLILLTAGSLPPGWTLTHRKGQRDMWPPEAVIIKKGRETEIFYIFDEQHPVARAVHRAVACAQLIEGGMKPAQAHGAVYNHHNTVNRP